MIDFAVATQIFSIFAGLWAAGFSAGKTAAWIRAIRGAV